VPPADRAPHGAAPEAPRAADPGGPRPISALLAAVVVGAIGLAAFVKGSIALGFPLVATPLIALVLDAKTAIAVTLLPNVVMDAAQVFRRGGVLATARRLAPTLVLCVPGTVLGTYLLVLMSARAAAALLGAAVLAFVALSAVGRMPRIGARWEGLLGALAGLAAGLLSGVTNAAGPPLAMYFQGIRLTKQEFVRSIALAFVTVKATQLGATGWYGLLTGPVLLASVGLTAVGLVGFAAGLACQDRLAEATFQRVVLGFLAVVGTWLIARTF
jgi:hypothetical protein